MKLIIREFECEYLLFDTETKEYEWLNESEIRQRNSESQIKGVQDDQILTYRQILTTKARFLGCTVSDLFLNEPWIRKLNLKLEDLHQAPFIAQFGAYLVEAVDKLGIINVYDPDIPVVSPRVMDSNKRFDDVAYGMVISDFDKYYVTSGYVREQVAIDFKQYPLARNLSTMFLSNATVEQVEFDFTDSRVCITSLFGVFQQCENLQSVRFINFDASDVESTSSMFHKCSHLQVVELDLSNAVMLTDMSSMFSGCSELNYLDVHNWNLSSIKYFSRCFENCERLISLDLSACGRITCEDCSFAFYNCVNLRRVDMSNFSFSQGTNASKMFYNCQSLESVKFPSERGGLFHVVEMFSNCKSLKEVDLSQFCLRSSCKSMFEGCESLESVTLGDLSWVSEVTDMFKGCKKLRHLRLPKSSPEKFFSKSNLGLSFFCKIERYDD